MPPSDKGSKGEPPDPPPSFNPRTWVGGKAPSPSQPPPADSPPPGGGSFDPKTWIRLEPSSPAATRAAPSRRGLVVVLGGVTAVVAVGGAALIATRRRHPPATAKTAAPTTQPRTAALADTVRFEADSALLMQMKLTQYGFAASEAAAAADAVRGVLGAETGQLRVTAVPVAPAHMHGDHIATLTARRIHDGAGARVDRVGERLTASALAANLTSQLCATAQGEMADTVQTSFIGVLHDDELVAQFIDALAFDINFAHDLAPGDQFSAVYEETRDADGDLIGGRRLVLAFLDVKPNSYAEEFQGVEKRVAVAARTIKLYRFDPEGNGKAAWFDESGASTVRDLMRTPVDGARITSKFGLREHPIFEVVKFHEGVDFGCPIGTKVYAAGDGVVTDARVAQGFGNYLRIQHGDHLWTAYGHLSGYAPGIKPGVKVKQGDVVAFTGNTGNSTGPHLHFEIRIGNYEAVDPLTYVGNRTNALTGAQLAAFIAERNRIDAAVSQCSVDSGAA